MQKQAKHLNIDTKSAAFQDIIRFYWMPRLLQKIEGSSTTLPIQNSETPLPLDNASKHSAAAVLAAQISPPPQISMQGDPNVRGTIHGLNIQKQTISDWENCTSSCMDSLESMKMSQISQFSGYPTIPFQTMVNTGNNTLGNGCSNVMTNSHDNVMDTYKQETISASGMFENPVGDCHVANNSWTDSDFLGSMWNMDELWQ